MSEDLSSGLAHCQAFGVFALRHSVLADERLLPLPGLDHCDNCGVCQVAGLTCKVRIRYKKEVTGRSRVLIHQCLVCQNRRKLTGLVNRRREPVSRKKTKRKSELAAMLEKKKNPKLTLSLLEFMKS